MSIIIQPAFEIPIEIAERLLTGELIRYGGVIRDTAGRLVTHLKEVPIPTQSEQSVMSKIANVFKTSRGKIAFFVGLGIVVVGGGITIRVIGKNKKKKQLAALEIAKCIEDYNTSLCIYLDAIRNRNLDINIINSLISNLDKIKENHDIGKISIDFSTEQLDTLLNLVFYYTKELAEANFVELDKITDSVSASADNSIIGLRHYLEIQRQIFEKAS